MCNAWRERGERKKEGGEEYTTGERRECVGVRGKQSKRKRGSVCVRERGGGGRERVCVGATVREEKERERGGERGGGGEGEGREGEGKRGGGEGKEREGGRGRGAGLALKVVFICHVVDMHVCMQLHSLQQPSSYRLQFSPAPSAISAAAVAWLLLRLCVACSAGWRSLTEDHRIAGNPAEAARLTAKNSLLPGGVSNRLYGLNIARMLGDRFLKEADVGFTAEPFISEGIGLGAEDEVLLIVASDGLWDVVSQERVAAVAAKTAAATAAAARTPVAGVAAGNSLAADGSRGTCSASGDSGGSCNSCTDGGTANTMGACSEQQQEHGSKSSVAAAVAEALMHAALSLRSKDDISIMVLHVLPASVGNGRAVAGAVSASGCM